MRKLASILSLWPALAAGQQFQVGAQVKDFVLAEPSGRTVRYSPEERGLTVVAFISARCPVSNAFNDRMSVLFREYSPKGVRFLFVNANANETPVEVAEHAKSAGFPFVVLKDPDNVVADAFGAMATPETFVIDAQGVLRYRGFIDDAQNPARTKDPALRNALDMVLAGKLVTRAETKSFGCTIKRIRRVS